jgi:hypothetical protein
MLRTSKRAVLSDGSAAPEYRPGHQRVYPAQSLLRQPPGLACAFFSLAAPRGDRHNVPAAIYGRLGHGYSVEVGARPPGKPMIPRRFGGEEGIRTLDTALDRITV